MPTSKRVSRPVTNILTTRDEAERAVAEYAVHFYTRAKMAAKLDLELAAVRDRFQKGLASLSESLEALEGPIQAWAEGNPSEFQERKSIEFAHGTIGFRSGMPRLAPAKGSTWKRVLEELAARWPRYVRRKEEPDKEALLADAAKLPLSLMRLTVVQDEKFFIEPKQEEPAQ